MTARNDFVRNACACDASPNHHDAMVLGGDHMLSGN
jgi:hypothetical protein